MKTNVSSRVRQSPCPTIKTTIILAAFALFTTCLIGSAQRVSSPSPRTDRSVKVSGVRLTVPKGFGLEQSSSSGFAFMRHEKEDLALFVAVLKNQQVNDAYLTDLSSRVVSQLLPQEQRFVWKVSRRSEPK